VSAPADPAAAVPAAAPAAIARLTGPGGEFELATEDVLGTPMTVFARRHRNLGEVLAASAGLGDRDYLVTADGRLSYREHARAVASLAAALRGDYGVRPGDRIAINAANGPGWVVSFWAAVAVGAITVGCNAWWTRRETGAALRLTEPAVVIADARRVPLSGGKAPVLSMEEDIPRLSRARPGAALDPHRAGEDDPAVILFTSGTSGRPKGAVHSHRNLTSVVEYHRLNDAISRELGAPGDPADGRYLLGLPLFHIAGLHNLVVPRLATGAAIVIYEGAFDVDRALRLIEKERVTSWAVVPTMASRLVRHPGLERYDLSSLTAFSLATAPSSPAFKERLRKAFPVAQRVLAESYGQTESSTAITVASPADLMEAPGTVGRPIPTVQLEIRDAGGAALPEGEKGEVCARSPFNMLGYWRDEEATTRTLRAGRWLHTGDIGLVRGGRLFLTARRSDLILRGGENVYPAEVENVLSGHPAVLECAVVGVGHSDLGEEVAAVVVTGPGRPPAEGDLRSYARQRLAYYKVPSRWLITTAALPRNATGKVMREEVRRAFGAADGPSGSRPQRG
jgi:acyl-CoA synthetase (AMP-forming)/AMP-acid ligase II